MLKTKQEELIFNIIMFVLMSLMPIIWYGVYSVFQDPKASDPGLVIICLLSMIISIISIMYMRIWVISDGTESLFD